MNVKKLIGKLHLWLGLSCGLVIVLLGITGCILAFEYEIREFIYKDRYFIEPQTTTKRSIEELLPLAQQYIGKEHPISGINVYQNNDRSFSFSTFKANPDGWNYFNTLSSSYTIYLNPYSGELLKIENSKMEFFRVVLMLHYNLLLENIGQQVIGWSTIIFIILLISGLYLWWPRNKAAAKQRFSFQWKANTKWKRKNYDLHNILGFYAMIFALIVALTGLVWAFTWFDNGVQWLANGGKETPVEKEYHSDSTAVKNSGVFDIVLKDMQQRAPNEVYYIGIPDQKSAIIYANSQAEKDDYQWTSLNYDQYTGKNLSSRFYHEKTFGEKLRNMNYYIHTGGIISIPGKILAFVLSLICAGLPISGFYIWWGRNNKKKKNAPVKTSGSFNKL